MKKNKKFFTRSICQECGQKQENCCTYYVPLTTDDIKRITNLGFPLKKFARLSMYTRRELVDEENWWINSLINIDNRFFRITTKLKRNGQCFFLKNKKGCLLGKDRPWECKLYPFWLEKNKLVFQDKSCYLVKRGCSLEKSIETMNEKRNNLKNYFLKIKKDFIQRKKNHQQLAKNLKKRYA